MRIEDYLQPNHWIQKKLIIEMQLSLICEWCIKTWKQRAFSFSLLHLYLSFEMNLARHLIESKCDTSVSDTLFIPKLVRKQKSKVQKTYLFV